MGKGVIMKKEKGLIIPPTYFYVSLGRAEKLMESEPEKYGKDTIIVGCVEIPNGIGYLVKGDDIKTIILDYSEEQ